MEYYSSKMIFHIVCYFLVLKTFNCHPYPPNLELLELNPQDVNSLEQDEPAASLKFQNNGIEGAVREVERIIQSNAELPRLTRGEILDFLENITFDNQAETKSGARKRDPKSIMVVMPYTPSSDKNMEDLYTKPPVTHIIAAEPFKTRNAESEGKTYNKIKHSRRRPLVKQNTEQSFREDVVPTSTTPKIITTIPPRSQYRRRRPPVNPTETPVTVTTYRPLNTITTYHPRSRRPVKRRTTVFVGTTQNPQPQYFKSDDFTPKGGITIVESPKLGYYSKDEDLEYQADVRREVVVKPESLPPAMFVTKSQLTPLSEDFNLPADLKSVIKDLNVESALNPREDVKAELEQRLKSTLEQQNRIKSVLASMGILPDTTTTSTTTAVPSAEAVAANLSPEMRDLLMNFGLLRNDEAKAAKPQADSYYPEKAEVKPESYIGFKPLPDDGPSRDDMDALLASFGLGRSARQQKGVKLATNTSAFKLDVIPEQMEGIVSDLGLAGLNNREENKGRTKQHIFNPDNQTATEEELKKLDKLMGLIKQLEKINGTATDEDLKEINMDDLQELVTSLNESNNDTLVTLEDKERDNSPDPTQFDVGLAKNEVKRQETTTVKTIVLDTGTPSLKDLEDSFGGQTEPPTLPPIPESTTQKSGFYYLVDWNTFLDIDDTKGKRVNLRFQPTIGDPKRFYSVSVP